MNSNSPFDLEQVMSKFIELENKLKSSSEDRHRINNSINSAITNLIGQTEQQDEVLTDISKSVQLVAESVLRVEQCLVGEPKFERVGLIKEVGGIHLKHASLETKVTLVTEMVKENQADLRNQRRLAAWIVLVVGSIGAVITWVKSTDFFKFLKGD